MKKVIIIGAGIAGLTAGIYLKQNNYEVEIYEKNPYGGGFLTSWWRKGSCIDGCLHWMFGTKKGTGLNKIWDNVGDINKMEIITTECFYKAIMGEKTFCFYNDLEKLEEEFYRYSENDDEIIRQMFEGIRALRSSEIPCDVPYELADPKSLTPDKELLRKTIRFVRMSVHDLAMKFNSELIRFALENGLLNNKFSAYFFLTTIANLTSGNASLPKGGSHKLRDNMVSKFLSLGGKLIKNADVSEIISENNQAKGIVVNNQVHEADYIVAANDLHNLFHVLLKDKYPCLPFDETDKDHEKYPAYSFFIASYRTKHDFKGNASEIIRVKPYKVLGKEHHIMSVRGYDYDDTLLNGDYRTVQVMLFTDDEDYDKLVKLSDTEYKDLKKNISEIYGRYLEEYYHDSFECIDVLSPKTFERYNHSYKGSFQTYVMTPKTPQILRSNLIEGLENVVIANQWVFLPGGTPSAVVNGKFAAQLVLYKDGRDYNI